MIEYITYFVYHRASIHAERTGVDVQSSSALFDAAIWLALIVLVNLAFLALCTLTMISTSALEGIPDIPYTTKYKAGLCITIFMLLCEYLAYRRFKSRVHTYFHTFEHESAARRKERMLANKWIYRVTTVLGCLALCCVLFNRWRHAGTIL